MTSSNNPPDVEVLLPCPFCGAHPKFESYGPGACFRIYCDGPDCTAYPSVRKYSNGDAPDKATRAWNTRMTAKDEASLADERLRKIYFAWANEEAEAIDLIQAVARFLGDDAPAIRNGDEGLGR